MNCLYCGKASATLLCDDCLTIDKLDEVFFKVLFFNGENCTLENVRSFVEGFENSVDAKRYCQELCAK